MRPFRGTLKEIRILNLEKYDHDFLYVFQRGEHFASSHHPIADSTHFPKVYPLIGESVPECVSLKNGSVKKQIPYFL